MPRMSKKAKREWAFFLSEYGRRRYNRWCNRCVHDCKQSYRATLLCCPRYVEKTGNRPKME